MKPTGGSGTRYFPYSVLWVPGLGVCHSGSKVGANVPTVVPGGLRLIVVGPGKMLELELGSATVARLHCAAVSRGRSAWLRVICLGLLGRGA